MLKEEGSGKSWEDISDDYRLETINISVERVYHNPTTGQRMCNYISFPIPVGFETHLGEVEAHDLESQLHDMWKKSNYKIESRHRRRVNNLNYILKHAG